MNVRSRLFGFNATFMGLCVIRKHEFSEMDFVQTCVMRPAAIRRLGVTGKMPVLPGRMDAIQNMKTMAGSPDADHTRRSASRNLAHGFCVSGVPSFVNR